MAARVQFGNIPASAPEPTAWPIQNSTLYALIWAIGLIVVFAPLASRSYQRAGAR